jgi:hypothetical protein
MSGFWFVFLADPKVCGVQGLRGEGGMDAAILAVLTSFYGLALN